MRAKLTPFGRRLIFERVLKLGWSVAEAAKAAGVSRATAHKWVRRYREEGLPGLEDRSSRARRRLKQGPHQLAGAVGSPRSTIYGVLRRHHMSRLAHLDRPTGIPIRYERERPGELVHIDVKKLGRIPPGGGRWRIHGRNSATKHPGGWVRLPPRRRG